MTEPPAIRPWLTPRRLPFVRVGGTRAHLLPGDPLEFGAASARTLDLCDGEWTAGEIAAALCAEMVIVDERSFNSAGWLFRPLPTAQGGL